MNKKIILLTVFFYVILNFNFVMAKDIDGNKFTTNTPTFNTVEKSKKFIIKYKESANESKVTKTIDNFVKNNNKKVEVKQKKIKENKKQKNKNANYSLIEFSSEIPTDSFITKLKKNNSKEIEYIQPDILMELSDAEIATEDAEKIEKSNLLEDTNSNVVIGLIDTGVDVTHPQLNNQIVQGYDFIENSVYSFNEENSENEIHGTHITGIITSVSSQVKVMPLKVFENGTAYTSDIIEAINYATDNNIRIVNCSWGSCEDNPILYETMKNSEIIFVCAAGNNRYNLDETPVYPACYDLNNIISVTSVDEDDNISYFSNYSNNKVDIAAKGKNINSTFPNAAFGTMSGTSMACGYVSGAIALYLSQYNDDNIINQLFISANKNTVLQDKIKDGNILSIDNYINKIEGKIITTVFEDSDNIETDENLGDSWELFSSLKNVQVCAADSYSVVLKSDGSVWAFGENIGYGELGSYSDYATYNPTPIKIKELNNIIKIDAKYEHCLALSDNGTVYSWGANYWGQLGDGTCVNRMSPLPIPELKNIVDIFAGYYSSAAIDKDGFLYVWGDNTQGELGNKEYGKYVHSPIRSEILNVKSISLGENFTLIVKNDGSVFSVGENGYGQLGNGTTDDNVTLTKINIDNVKSVFASDYSSIALKQDGTVWTWGINSMGQLGNGTTVNSSEPVQIPELTNIKQIGKYMALDDNNNVWIWSKNANEAYITRPIIKDNLENIIQISQGRDHCLTLDRNGIIWSWGDNDGGQLGYGNIRYRTLPVQVFGMNNVKKIVGGYDFVIILKEDGSVWKWGYSTQGALGGSITTIYSPTQIQSLTDICDIAVGYQHCLALTENGDVYSWGYNYDGQLGDGTKNNKNSPVKISLSNIKKIAAGYRHSMAIDYSGNLYTWGDNSSKQLGNGTTTDLLFPTLVSGCNDIIDISAGYSHCVALKNDGSVWSWGGSAYINPEETVSIPQQIAGLENIVKLSSCYYNNLALNNNGEVFAWGSNKDGQLGDGTTTGRYYPKKISNLSNITDIYSLYSSSFAQDVNGTIYAWGKNTSGELANGTRKNVFVPTVSKLENIVCMARTNYNIVFSVDNDGYLYGNGANRYTVFDTIVVSDTSIPHQINDIYENEVFVTDSNFSKNSEILYDISNGLIDCNIELQNVTDQNLSASVIMILKNKNCDTIKQISATEKNLKPLGTTWVECGMTVPDDYEDYYIEVKIWDSISQMNVLTSDITFN